MDVKADYLGHDGEYCWRRAAGRVGWDAAEGYQQTFACIDRFLAGVVFPAAPTMIELGCGAGDLSLHFAARGFRVLGLDIAPFAVAWAREKAAARGGGLRIEFDVGDLTRELETVPEQADLVLDGHCLHCIIGTDRAVFLHNARRCLKPGGIFFVYTMCGTPHPPHDRHFDAASRCLMTGGIARRYFGMPADILRELQAAGFVIARQEVIPAQYDGDEDCLLVEARGLE